MKAGSGVRLLSPFITRHSALSTSLQQLVELVDQAVEIRQGRVDRLGFFHVHARGTQQIKWIFRAAPLEKAQVVVNGLPERLSRRARPARSRPTGRWRTCRHKTHYRNAGCGNTRATARGR